MEIQGLTVSIDQSCPTVAAEFFTGAQQHETQERKTKPKKTPSRSNVKSSPRKKDPKDSSQK